MKRKIFLLLLSVTLSIPSLTLVGCDGSKGGHDHAHSFSTEWSKDEKQHWKQCECGEKEGLENHNWGTGTVIINATCETDGLKVYTCECGATKSETLPHTHHSFTNYISNNDATCAHDGTKTAKCDKCDETYTILDEGSRLTTHVPGAAIRENEVSATCIKAGSYDSVVYCSVCGVEISREQKVVPVSDVHNYGEWQTTKQPTCDQQGEETRVCALEESHKETRPINPIGHHLVVNDESTRFTWDFDTKKAYLNLHCDREKCLHTETREMAVATSIFKAADCENPAQIRYTATTNYNEVQFSDEQIINEGDKNGHTFKFDSFIWDNKDGVVTAKAKLLCENDPSHISILDDVLVTKSDTPTVNADCERNAIYTYTATYEGESDSKQFEEKGTATGHHLEFSGYRWAPDYQSANAVYVCNNSGCEHEEEYAANVISEKFPATCVEYSFTNYTAKYGSEVSETKKLVTGDVYGTHDFKFVEFVWEGNKAYAKLSCDLDDPAYVYLFEVSVTEGKKVREASCTETEIREYTAKYGEHTETKQIELGTAAGHNYEFKKFEWEEDHSAAKALYICSECKDEARYDATIKATTISEKDCSHDKIVTYRASHDDHSELIENVVVDQSEGHNFETFSRFVFDFSNEVLYAEYKCTHDSKHLSVTPVAFDKNETQPSCKNDGFIEYDAKIDGHYFHEKISGAPRTGHIPGEPVRENQVAATCITDGSYDEVIRCTKCGEIISTNHVVVPKSGHTLVKNPDLTVAATCTSEGYDVYECSDENCSYTEHRNIVAPTGHQWDKELSCLDGHECIVCGATEKALGHNYIEVNSTIADCVNSGETTYQCDRCSNEYTVVTTPALGHEFDEEHVKEVLQNGETCVYDKVYSCLNCDHEEVKGTVEHHNYVAAVTTEATCSTDGLKTYTCSKCGDTKTETIEKDPSKHVWVLGDVNNGVRVDTCSECSDTRSVVVYDPSGITASQASNNEVSLANNTSIKIDEQILADEDSDAKVEIGVDELSIETLPEEVKLSEEQKAQVGSNPIYDFSLKSDEKQISDFGDNYVTITLPYTLGGEEDVDNIAVWFISDSGELESIPAEYANGFITFKTNHFSYYTVTRLSVEERCALYGHSYVLAQEVDATCTSAGYKVEVCVRCHDKVTTETAPALGHNYIETDRHEATCDNSGQIEYTCTNCSKVYYEIIPSLGHELSFNGYKWGDNYSTAKVSYSCVKEGCKHVEEFDATVEIDEHEATCLEDGYILYTASFGEEEPVTVLITTDKAFGHKPMDAVVENEDPATCLENGSHDEVVYCEECHEELSRKEVVDLATGHEWGNWHTINEISCIENGIEQRDCAHCDEFEQRTHYSSGHTPAEAVQENVVQATCESDGSYDEVVYCSVCGEELSRTHIDVPSLGHDWGEWVVITPATCESEGLERRTCLNDEEHFEERIIPVAEHTRGEAVQENIVEPTCNKEGSYDEVVYCSVCGEELSRIQCESSALGHDYVVTFDFAKDYSSAVATFVCLNDPTHTFSREIQVSVVGNVPVCYEKRDVTYHAEITFNGITYSENLIVEDVILEHIPGETVEELIHEASCAAPGEYDLVVYCKACGKELSREQHFIEKLEHTSSELLSVEDGHYHECIVCHEILDGEEHEFTDLVIKGATCSENGKVRHTCSECGYSYETVIPKTNEHHYVNGHCSVCGKEEIDCDHTQLHEVILDLGEHGYCEGKLYFMTCDCGEIMLLDPTKVAPGCEAHMSMIEEGTTTYKGKEDVPFFSFTCDECGLTYIQYLVLDEKVNCEYHEVIDFLILDENNNQLVLATVDESYESHNYSTEPVTILLDECGSRASYYECKDCHKILSTPEVVIMCSGTPVVEEHEDGTSYYMKGVFTCEETGLVLTQILRIRVEGCNTINYIYTSIVKPDGEKIEYEGEYTDSHHDFERTYELMPGSHDCSDGVTVIETCKICGYTHTYKTTRHYYEYVVTDFSEFSGGICSGRIEYQQCSCCGHIDVDPNLINRMLQIHNFTNTEPGQPFEKDGVTYLPFYMVCEDCDFVIDAIQYVVTKGCETYYYVDGKVYYDEEEPLFEFEKCIIDRETNHFYRVEDIEFEDEILGCEGGVRYAMVCDVCGERSHHSTYGHRYEDMTDIALKGIFNGEERDVGSIRYFDCIVCGDSVIQMNWFEPFRFPNAQNIDEVVIDGITYSGIIYSDESGKLIVKVLNAEVKVDNCHTYNYRMYIIDINDDHYEGTYINCETKHDFEYTIRFDDEELGCEGGYQGFAKCKYCGYEQTISGMGHRIEQEIIDLAQYGACNHNVLVIDECVCCGETNLYIKDEGCNFRVERTDFDENHYVLVKICEDCGLKEVIDCSYTHGEKCEVIYKRIYSFEIGDFSYSGVHINKYFDHNFGEPTYTSCGDDCERDGVLVKVICEDCGYVEEYNSYGHQYKETYIDFGELGACPSYFVKNECQVCGEHYCSFPDPSYYHNFEYSVDEQYIDENGILYTNKIGVCEDCGMIYTYSTIVELNENCYGDEVGYESVTFNGITYTREVSKSSYYHKVNTEYVMLGETCEEGIEVITACEHCHEVQHQWTVYGHVGNWEYVYFDDYNENLTDHYIALRECECCHKVFGNFEYILPNYHYNSDNRVEEDGYLHYLCTYWDEQEGYSYRLDIDSIYIHESECLTRVESYHTLVIDGKLIKEFVIVSYEEQHEFIYTFEFDDDSNHDCEAGVTYYGVCKYCGKEMNFHTTWHNEVEVIYNAADYGCECGGNIYVNSCACGRYCSINYGELGCDLDGSYPIYETPEGYISKVTTIYKCAVTDPLCEFTITIIKECYWVSDDSCEQGERYTYIFGSDESNQLILVKEKLTGFTHSIETTTDRVELEDGCYEIHTVAVCSRCGAKEELIERYNSNDFRYEYEHYDFVENYYEKREMVEFIYDNESFELLTYNYIEDLTSDYWWSYEYSYDFDCPCYYKVIARDAEGYYLEEYSEDHLIELFTILEEPTCSQDGGCCWYCPICGYSSNENHLSALGHYFVWNEDKQIYVCERCGLESIVGVNGDIILEDLTGDNEDAYVIGYCVGNNVQYTQFVSILVHETEEEIILDNIDIIKIAEPRAYTFGKSDVEDYALEAGYEPGEYDIKFTFVPYGGDSLLDYAIILN